ncbi:MAG: DUF5990 family protein [Acidobacteriota bacterium]
MTYSMATKYEIPIRIRVLHPPAGVMTKVQRGKNELLPPTKVSDDGLEFDFDVTVDLSGASPNFLGKYAHGPKDVRFLYVNSGTSAGQHFSCWTRRAKISLMSITRTQIDAVIAGKGVLLAAYNGTGRDGGPTCASVKGIEWKVVPR